VEARAQLQRIAPRRATTALDALLESNEPSAAEAAPVAPLPAAAATTTPSRATSASAPPPAAAAAVATHLTAAATSSPSAASSSVSVAESASKSPAQSKAARAPPRPTTTLSQHRGSDREHPQPFIAPPYATLPKVSPTVQAAVDARVSARARKANGARPGSASSRSPYALARPCSFLLGLALNPSRWVGRWPEPLRTKWSYSISSEPATFFSFGPPCLRGRLPSQVRRVCPRSPPPLFFPLLLRLLLLACEATEGHSQPAPGQTCSHLRRTRWWPSASPAWSG
jgi:hypothetical protein